MQFAVFSVPPQRLQENSKYGLKIDKRNTHVQSHISKCSSKSITWRKYILQLATGSAIQREPYTRLHELWIKSMKLILQTINNKRFHKTKLCKVTVARSHEYLSKVKPQKPKQNQMNWFWLQHWLQFWRRLIGENQYKVAMAHLKTLHGKKSDKHSCVFASRHCHRIQFFKSKISSLLALNLGIFCTNIQSPTGWLLRAILFNLSAPVLDFPSISSTFTHLAPLSYY